MKKILLPILICFSSFSVNAQAVADSIDMGEGYLNEVFYQLGTQAKTAVPFNGTGGWDIGFQTTLMNASIISDENSILVFKAPNADSTDYASLDVSGYAGWQQLYNSDSTWDKGAFNMGADPSNYFDFGWGIYDFNTHEVYGDSLFVLVKGTDVYKLWIRKKTAGGDYILRYANTTLGGGDVDVTIPAASYSSKNFVYLNLATPATIDLEPASSDWDILFTRYFTYIPYAGMYPVTGVFSNTGVTVAQADSVDLSTVSYADYSAGLSANLTEIGYDWKVFIQPYGPYVIVDSLIYFVKAKDNSIFSLHFTDFNSTTGKTYFETEKLLTGIDELKGNLTQAVLYPNPSTDQVNIVCDALANSVLNVRMFDLTGRELLQYTYKVRSGLNVESLDLPEVSPGVYNLMLSTGDQQVALKLMVIKQ
ncbi:MAG: T9SS type A sorting domain-containing protein [Chitinophagales bacterium]